MRDEKIFKSYDDLKAKFDKVMPVKPYLSGSTTNAGVGNVPPVSGPRMEADPQNEAGNASSGTPDGSSFAEQMNDSENASVEDNLAYFQNLAESTDI
jgi:hypothetical protein